MEIDTAALSDRDSGSSPKAPKNPYTVNIIMKAPILTSGLHELVRPKGIRRLPGRRSGEEKLALRQYASRLGFKV